VAQPERSTYPKGAFPWNTYSQVTGTGGAYGDSIVTSYPAMEAQKMANRRVSVAMDALKAHYREKVLHVERPKKYSVRKRPKCYEKTNRRYV